MHAFLLQVNASTPEVIQKGPKSLCTGDTFCINIFPSTLAMLISLLVHNTGTGMEAIISPMFSLLKLCHYSSLPRVVVETVVYGSRRWFKRTMVASREDSHWGWRTIERNAVEGCRVPLDTTAQAAFLPRRVSLFMVQGCALNIPEWLHRYGQFAWMVHQMRAPPSLYGQSPCNFTTLLVAASVELWTAVSIVTYKGGFQSLSVGLHVIVRFTNHFVRFCL